MCVRTKTSYDCGHTHKQDQSCHRHSCTELERYHFKNEGDCRQCRKAGEAVSRGREGQGRYARELYKKEHKSSSNPVPLSTTSQNSQSSPWAPPDSKERAWSSRIRRRADEAWEEEHARREQDLQSRSASSRGGSVRSVEPDHAHDQHERDDYGASIREELRRVEDAERIRVRRQRDRQASYDSFDSYGESHRSNGSGLYSHGHYSSGSGRRSHESGRSRMYDSRFSSSKHNPYNLYNTESYFSGLGHGLGEMVRDSGRKWARW
ncbi:hypothetical protein GJ744_010420 [Endocarpon pusillum]|uniref:Uncharacterized protein n=1 Tax=Endocarpon pusillum TaxID=364733 RepID=A0A8H7E1V6_9EURO|nr:hypothetical protein GJ744_010420 [Endocarpon pusillum]